MKNKSPPDPQHKHIMRDCYLNGFSQPGRFRREWEKVKALFREKNHG